MSAAFATRRPFAPNWGARLAWVLLRREEDYDPLHGHARPAQPA